MTEKAAAATRQSPMVIYKEKCPEFMGTMEEFMTTVGKMSEKYIQNAKTVQELCEEFPSIPARVIRHMIRSMKWDSVREENMRQVYYATALQNLEYIRANQHRVANEITAAYLPKLNTLAPMLQEAINSGDSVAVRRITESIKHLSDVVTGAVTAGSALPGAPDWLSKGNDGGEGQKTWLQLIAKGPVNVNAAPRDPAAEAIDVSEGDE